MSPQAGMLTFAWLRIEHEPEYFAAVEHLSDAQLAGFTVDDLREVRVAVSAYGLHLFGKVHIPSLPDEGPAFIHFRAFTGGPDDQATLHSIRRFPLSRPTPMLGATRYTKTKTGWLTSCTTDTEDKEEPSGGHTYRAIFTKDDILDWFDT